MRDSEKVAGLIGLQAKGYSDSGLNAVHLLRALLL